MRAVITRSSNLQNATLNERATYRGYGRRYFLVTKPRIHIQDIHAANIGEPVDNLGLKDVILNTPQFARVEVRNGCLVE